MLWFKMWQKEVSKCHLEGKWRIEQKILAKLFVFSFFFSPRKSNNMILCYNGNNNTLSCMVVQGVKHTAGTPQEGHIVIFFFFFN